MFAFALCLYSALELTPEQEAELRDAGLRHVPIPLPEDEIAYYGPHFGKMWKDAERKVIFRMNIFADYFLKI